MFENLRTADIELVPPAFAQAPSAARIREIILSGFKALEHGKRFTGKPGTLIFEADGEIVKIHAAVEMAEIQARQRAEFNARHESELGIYHPSKAWFVVKTGNRCWMGNVMQVLQPLHMLMVPSELARALDLLDQYFSIYIGFMKNQERVLDPGLSNFAVDEEGRVFYLDDDIYGWDGFSSLTQTIGVWFRQLTDFPEEFFGSLGTIVGKWLSVYYPDSEWADIVSEQVRGVFVANADQSLRQERFLRALADVKYGKQAAEDASPVLYAVPQDAQQYISAGQGKVAILADIHSNLPALECALAELDRRAISRVLILGDLVGYGPHPSACIELLRSRDFAIIRGNHDHAAAVGKAAGGFSAGARWVIDWTVQRLSKAERQWLGSLPLYLDGDGWLAVHGAPQDRTFMNGYVYRMTYEDNLQNLKDRDIQYCFHGHTHVAGVYYDKGKLNGHSVADHFALENVDRSLICPGSIGQPRGGKVGLEFAVLDTGSFEIDFLNLDYDPSSVIEEMNREGFPGQLSSRLLIGK